MSNRLLATRTTSAPNLGGHQHLPPHRVVNASVNGHAMAVVVMSGGPDPRLAPAAIGALIRQKSEMNHV